MVVAVLIAIFASSRIAFAGEPDRYCAVVIANPSSVKINVLYRGSSRGNWKSCDIPPGKQLELYSKLIDGKATKPEIRFDCVAGDSEVTEKHYSLSYQEVKNGRWRDGKPYFFEYSRSGKTLDLYEER